MGRVSTKKAYKNIAAEGVYQVVTLVSGLILPRFIIRTYGSEYNGMIQAITQLLNFIAILRMGVAGATRVELYKSLGNDDIKKTSGIITATEKFMRKIAVALVIYIAVLMVVYPLWVRSEYGWLNVSILVFVIGLGVFAEYFFGITYSTLLDADQKLYVYTSVRIVLTILNVIISCILITQGVSIQVVKLFSCLLFAICPIFLYYYVPKHYCLDKKAPADTSALKKRRDVVASSIANIVHDNTDVIVLTLLMTPKDVSVYSIYNLIIGGLKKVILVFVNGMESFFGLMWARKEIDSIYGYFRKYEYFIAVFISVVFSSTMVLILPFIKLYTKGVTDTQYVLPVYAVLVVISQAVYSFRQPYLTLVQAAGHYKQTKVGAYYEAGINIVLSIILTYFYGIVGVVIGTLAANAFRSLQYSIYISKNILPRPFSIVLLRILWIAVNFVICIIADRILFRMLHLTGITWYQWVIQGFIAVVTGLIVCMLSSFVFYRSDLLWLCKKTQDLLRKLKR